MPVGPGVHGVTNGRLDDPSWPKLEHGKARLGQLVASSAELREGRVPWQEVGEVQCGAWEWSAVHGNGSGVQCMGVDCSA